MEHQVDGANLIAGISTFFGLTTSLLTFPFRVLRLGQPLDHARIITRLSLLQTQRISEVDWALPSVEVLGNSSPAKNPFVLEEAAVDGVEDPRGAGEQTLAAVCGKDLDPRLALVAESVRPRSCRTVGDDRPEGVVFPGGRESRKKIPIASE
jgi:hypothetical protein